MISIKKLKKSRGISPIIAQILLIGLVITAGAIMFTTVLISVNTKDPITLSVRDVSDFKLSGTDNVSTKYNSFSILVENSGTRDVGILNSTILLYDADTMNPLLNWEMESDQILESKISKYILLKSSSNLESDWLSINDSFLLEIPIYSLDTEFNNADRATVTKSIVLGKELVSVGPLRFNTNLLSNSFNNVALNISDNSNNSLDIEIQNYGALDVNYTLDFIVSNRSLNLTVNYVNSLIKLSNHIEDSIPMAIGQVVSSSSNQNPNKSLTLTVTNSTMINPGADEFYITVWLRVNSKVFDTLFVICET